MSYDEAKLCVLAALLPMLGEQVYWRAHQRVMVVQGVAGRRVCLNEHMFTHRSLLYSNISISDYWACLNNGELARIFQHQLK